MSEIIHDLTWDWTQADVVRSKQYPWRQVNKFSVKLPTFKIFLILELKSIAPPRPSPKP
jgi:hypothetical protein